jgi:hypothetical protein
MIVELGDEVLSTWPIKGFNIGAQVTAENLWYVSKSEHWSIPVNIHSADQYAATHSNILRTIKIEPAQTFCTSNRLGCGTGNGKWTAHGRHGQLTRNERPLDVVIPK